jgi:hypothetical protein
MTVETLLLCGLAAAEAEQAADAMLDLDTGTGRLERLLVIDDTTRLDEHMPVYQHLVTAKRVEKLMSVAMGPRPGAGLTLELPGNLGGTQDWPVLWVSRPAGISWRVAKAAVANRYPGTVPAALDQHPLIRLLSADEMFDRVHRVFLAEVPARVASPGLWLAGADDESAAFAGALALAIRRICDSGPGNSAPFAELLPARAGGAELSETGPLARYLAQLSEMDRAVSGALARAGGLGGLFRRGDSDIQRYVVKAGEALADLRDLIVQVLRQASSAGNSAGLTASQRDLVGNAGLRFEVEATSSSGSGSGQSAVEHSRTYREVAKAIRGGDTIPRVARRLTMTERQAGRRGSASYVPDVEQLCPPTLLARLTDPAPKLPRGPVAETRHVLGLDEAETAARELTDLVLDVANREWSPSGVSARDLAGARTALDGTRKALTEYATAPNAGRAGRRGAQLQRLSERLLPMLCDLVLHVMVQELVSPSATGKEALVSAQGRANAMLAEWARHVQANGVAVQPPFATSAVYDTTSVIDDDVATIREALLYPPGDEMWQLCGPKDLGVLDVDVPPIAIRFASRISQEALTGTLPGTEPVWTSSGSYAGVLRLVPLRAGIVSWHWGKADPAGQPAFTEQ